MKKILYFTILAFLPSITLPMEKTTEICKLDQTTDFNVLRSEIKRHLALGHELDFGDIENSKCNKCSILAFHFNRCNDEFYRAILLGDIEKITSILNNDKYKINNLFLGRSALSWALLLKDKQIVKCLLERGASIDQKSPLTKLSPLQDSIFDTELKKLLTDHQDLTNNNNNNNNPAKKDDKSKDNKDVKKNQPEIYKINETDNLNFLRKEIKKHLALGHKLDLSQVLLSKKNNGCSLLACNYNCSNDELFQAILFGEKSKIGDLLKKDPTRINKAFKPFDPNSSKQHEGSPLSWALMLQDKEIVKYLLGKGAKINGESALNFPCAWYDTPDKELKKLMSPYGGSRFNRNEDFRCAIYNGDTEKLKEIYSRKDLNKKNKIDLLTDKGNHLYSPLCIAAASGNVSTTEFIIGQLTNLKKIHKHDLEEAFLAACASKNLSVIKFLFDVKFLKKNNKFNPFMYWGSKEVKESLYKLFIESHPDTKQNKLLEIAIKNFPHYFLMEFINDENVNIDQYDMGQKGYHMNPLLWACSYGDTEAIAILLSHGANANVVDRKGRSALRKVLRMHKGSPKKTGRQLSTSELLSCFLLLMCNGADPKISDNKNQDIYNWLNRQNFDAVAQDLINRILDINNTILNDKKELFKDIINYQKKELDNTKGKKDKQYIKNALLEEDISNSGLMICNDGLNLKYIYEDLLYKKS